jgi:hypothetical protein
MNCFFISEDNEDEEMVVGTHFQAAQKSTPYSKIFGINPTPAQSVSVKPAFFRMKETQPS